jgi:hypothetical protein
MKGDFTRSTFNKKKHNHKVKMQQGRAIIDADWNEQTDIDFHYERASLTDIIGRSGTPKDGTPGYSDGFKISVLTPGSSSLPTDYQISAGRYYVDGILCENEADVNASQQEDLRFFGSSDALPPLSKHGKYFVYLDWTAKLETVSIPSGRRGTPNGKPAPPDGIGKARNFTRRRGSNGQAAVAPVLLEFSPRGLARGGVRCGGL